MLAIPKNNRPERGQASLLMLIVVALVVAAAIALAVIGQAMVHRARARTAADAIALATAASPDDAAATSLQQWYRSQGVVVEPRADHTWAGSGPSQAAAWATAEPVPVETSPILRAIVARVEQLRGHSFATVTWQRSSFDLDASDAQIMQSLAFEFGLCGQATSDGWRFAQCG